MSTITENQNQEEWSQIPDFPRYEVSNLGNVRNRVRGKNLTLRSNNNTLRVELNITKDGKSKNYSKAVGRLVLEAFSPFKTSKQFYVRYKDGNFNNCSYSNLYWITKSQEIKRRITGQLDLFEYLS